MFSLFHKKMLKTGLAIANYTSLVM